MRFLAGHLLVLLAVVPLSQTFTYNVIRTYASSELQAASYSQFISSCCKGGRQRLGLCLRTPEGFIGGNKGLRLRQAGMIGMRGLVAGIKDEFSVHGSVGARNQPSQTIKAFLSSPPSCVQKQEEMEVQPVGEPQEPMVQVESDLMVWNDRLCEIMSSMLGMAALFLLVHCMYLLSLFTLGLRSVPAPWSFEAWRRAFIFARWVPRHVARIV